MPRFVNRGHLGLFPEVLVRNAKETATNPPMMEIDIKILVARRLSGGIILVMLREVCMRAHECLAWSSCKVTPEHPPPSDTGQGQPGIRWLRTLHRGDIWSWPELGNRQVHFCMASNHELQLACACAFPKHEPLVRRTAFAPGTPPATATTIWRVK